MTLKKLFQHKDVYLNQELENIVKNAQSKDFTISKTFPSDREGIDGEIRIFNPQPDYVSFLIKLNGKWFEFSLNKITTGFVAGKGIFISQDDNPVISNTGVLSLNNLSGDILLQGTSNQINVNTSGNNIILSTPQDIHTGATPTFADLYLSNLTPGSVLFVGQNGLISQNNPRLYWDNVNELLGVGTNILRLRLNIFGGIFARGSVGGDISLGNIGSDAFLIFYPRKGAFRAGAVYNNQWDDNNIGYFSFAGGRDTIASGIHSVALGYQNTANNDSAVALGYNNTASGQQSFAAGFGNIASGNRAVALGHQNTASGDGSVSLGYQSYASAFGSVALGVSAQASGYASSAIGNFAQAIGSGSVAIGVGTKANSLYSIALGVYNLGLGNPTSWVDTDPILELGIGTSDNNRRNAITILKNGYVGIGKIPETNLDVNGYIKGTNLIASSLTPGSILFVGSNGLLSQDNANLFWDNTNKNLNIGLTNGDSKISIKIGQVNYQNFSRFYAIDSNSQNENLLIRFNNVATGSLPANVWQIRSGGDAAKPIAIGMADNIGLFINTNNYIGIGTTNTPERLTVVGNIGLQAGTNAFIGTLDNYGLSIRTNNVDRIYITDNGKIRIGQNTSALNSLLTVNGDIETTGSFFFTGTTIPFFGTFNSVGLYIGTNNRPAISIGSDGRVVIGLTGVLNNAKLTVLGDIGAIGNIFISKGEDAFIGTLDNYALKLRTNNIDRIFITNDGKVGIGMSGPSAKLDIDGQGSDPVVRIRNTGGYPSLQFLPPSNTSARIWFTRPSDYSDRGSVLYDFANDYMSFRATGVENTLVLKSGNVGINTLFPLTSFHVKLKDSNDYVMIGYVDNSSGYGQKLILSYNTSNDYAIIQSRYDYPAPGSGPRNLILQSDGGNVGIGTTNPPAKLTVAGNIGIQSGGDAYIGTIDNYALKLRTNNIDRIYIANDGKVGVGTDPNSYNSQFAVVSSNTVDTRIFTGFVPNLNTNYVVVLGIGKSLTSRNSGWIGFKYIGDQSTNNYLTFGLYNVENILVITGNRNVGIRTTSPSYALQVGVAGDGTSAIANAWNTFSDIRLKEIIGEIKSDEALEKILSLQAKRFYYKNDENKKEFVGFIAQEVEEYIPEVVSTDNTEERYKAIAYEKLIPFLVEAIKQLHQELQEVKQWIKNKN